MLGLIEFPVKRWAQSAVTYWVFATLWCEAVELNERRETLQEEDKYEHTLELQCVCANKKHKT